MWQRENLILACSEKSARVSCLASFNVLVCDFQTLNMQADKSSRLILYPAAWSASCHVFPFYLSLPPSIFLSLSLSAFTWQLIKLREEVSSSMAILFFLFLSIWISLCPHLCSLKAKAVFWGSYEPLCINSMKCIFCTSLKMYYLW